MEMQDKEFDQLFKAKLNEFEAEPSENLWRNISGELGEKKSKRSIRPYLNIAASVVIAVSVSLWLLNRTDKIDEEKIKIVKRTKPANTQPAIEAQEAQTLVAVEAARIATKAIVSTKVQLVKKPVTIVKPVTDLRHDAIVVTYDITEQKNEQALAVTTVEKAPEIGAEALGDNGLQQTPTLTVAVQPVVNEKQPTTEANVPIQEKPVEKKKARGLGGLINTIVAVVDKREDKLIEFTDAENDEGSRLTAVNLGLFKIKKQ